MFGLCCILNKEKTKKGFVGITAFKKSENPLPKLLEATLHNIRVAKKSLQWAIDNNCMYRFSSDMVPFAEFWDWESNLIIKHRMAEIKRMVEENNVKTTIHPSQFCVINSEKEEAINNSIVILKTHAKLCNMLSIQNIIIHTGSAKGNFRERFITNFNELPKEIKGLIRLENCHSVSISEVLEICVECKIPPVLDVHHNRICGNIDISAKLINAISSLWEGVPIAHISSGRKHEKDRAHSDFITKEDIAKYKNLFKYFDFEVEAKLKNEAILQLK